jgi:hypothetical protein
VITAKDEVSTLSFAVSAFLFEKNWFNLLIKT